MKNEMIATMPNEPIPISEHWCINSFQYIFQLSGLVSIVLSIRKYLPTSVRTFNIVPRIAMLSYSNFGSSNSPEARLVAEARKKVKERMPSLIADGEMQASVAFNNELMRESYPFCELVDKDVNTLIFPNLAAGNIAYNLLKELGAADAIGPILLGLKKPVHVLQLGSSVRSIVNMATIAVVDAQLKSQMTIAEMIRRSPWWKRLKRKGQANF